jgi:hypothetical protein
MQCFEHLFLKHVLDLCNQLLLKTFDLKDYLETLKYIIL